MLLKCQPAKIQYLAESGELVERTLRLPPDETSSTVLASTAVAVETWTSNLEIVARSSFEQVVIHSREELILLSCRVWRVQKFEPPRADLSHHHQNDSLFGPCRPNEPSFCWPHVRFQIACRSLPLFRVVTLERGVCGPHFRRHWLEGNSTITGRLGGRSGSARGALHAWARWIDAR